MSFYIYKNIIIKSPLQRRLYHLWSKESFSQISDVPNYNDRNRLKKIAYNRVLVEKILPRAANIFQILQIPILSIFWKKEKNVSIGTTIFFRSRDNFWSTWPAWNEHRFKTRASGEGEGWWVEESWLRIPASSTP